MNAGQQRWSLRWERLAGWTLPAFAATAVASIALQNLIFIAIAAWLAGMAVRKQWNFTSTPLNWPMLLLGGALVLSSLFAGYLNASFFGLRKAGLMGIFFLTASVADQPWKIRRYLDFFCWGAGVCAAGSIVFHVLGWDGGRARSFSGDYMAAGGMYMLALVLVVARVLFERTASRWNWLLAAMLGTALLFTYTRSSWIGAGVALLVLGSIKDWKLPVLGMVVVAAFLALFPQHPFSQRFFSIRSSTHISNSERRLMWDTGLKLFRDRPVLGYGVDNLSRVYGRYVHPEASEPNPPHVHNTVLQIGLNGGLVAVVFFLWWVWAGLALAFRGWARQRIFAPERAALSAGLGAAFLGFLINGLFEFNFGTSQVITIVYFLLGLLPAVALARPGSADFILPRRPSFLFLRPRFRGDVLLASAVPRLIRRDFPAARVDLLTEPAAVEVARGEPAWDRVLGISRGSAKAWWQGIREIRERNYDVVCDLFGNPRTALLAALSGARLKIGPRVKGWGVVYSIRTQPDRPGKRPAWEAYFDVLRTLGMKNLSARPHWEVAQVDEKWAREFLRQARLRSKQYLGIFPGASHPSKRWPLTHFLEVSRRALADLGLKSLFVFGPAESDLKSEYVRSGGKLSQCADRVSPGQLAALWAQSAVVVSNDAFPLHLGPAVGTPTIGLFGPGEPEVWFPYAGSRLGHRALHELQDCWPCHRDVCSNPRCWRALKPERVLRAIAEVASKKRDRKK